MKTITDGKGFKVGLFGANCSSGLAATTVPERWSGGWEDNLRLARRADEVGIDFLLPAARWKGYGGRGNFHDEVLDPTTSAAGLLAHTSRLVVFSTVHTAFHHPLAVAKQLATLDQIGRGRAGINIVAGWNKPEYEAFGSVLPDSHDDRYALAQEWWDVVRAVWTRSDPFDHDGRFFHLHNAEGLPGPYDGPLPVINAGSSEQGLAYATRNADIAFTIVSGPEDGQPVVERLRDRARRHHNRTVGVFTPTHVVCRPTRREAEDYLHHYAHDHADWDAVDNLMTLQGLHARSFTPEMLATFRARFASGHGTCPLIGSPDDIADQIGRFHRSGFAGITVSFVDYLGELDYFAQEVLPRLHAQGLRTPA
ncbi:LLM class flavin-dependent oxidoreductase [Actinosynnema sp. NPDC047251]|uniref:Luciferase-like monooxygenase n=1 Tax=Saccharothrix espanaensis (strain ATCC 51144 / DSM 44229 / JCM 9112 / NBRC 15066 / NRRL 15764) TaxID=1179773 RepID=K0JWI7_SACES|nr:LLM class flavin-dependent oxidoreductase [Saccharothrix espanaensis]CCH32195.1 Luciferase-like monooxygenase [Saccharothrix espanaensis DSM 44229]